MIITRIAGGLGNQMSQYAVGLTIAFLRNTTLKLDLSFYDRPHPDSRIGRRKFSLDLFGDSFAIANAYECRRMLVFQGSKLGRAVTRFSPFYFRQPGVNFSDSVFAVGRHCYLEGTWMSERFFAPAATAVAAALTIRRTLSPEGAALCARIRGGPSVAVHVRRGDYLNLKEYALEPHYLGAALDAVRRRIGPAEFYVFSDDIQWCIDNLKIDGPVFYVDRAYGLERDKSDFILMRACRHFILANSSFSWWAAWLADNPDKLVVAPRRWLDWPGFRNEDVFPAGWVTL